MVLVLDEDADSRGLLRRLLELAGHDVLTCSDETQALQASRSGDLDLVIIHVKAGSRWSHGLPGLLKAGNKRRKILIIADYVSDQMRGSAMGDGFLAKPVELETIERKVRELLGLKTAGNSIG